MAFCGDCRAIDCHQKDRGRRKEPLYAHTGSRAESQGRTKNVALAMALLVQSVAPQVFD